MTKRHFFYSETMPPLCGQRDRRGLCLLPAAQTTTDPTLVTCAKCFALMSEAACRAPEPEKA